MRFSSALWLMILVAAVTTAAGAKGPALAATQKQSVLRRYGPPKKGSILYKFTRQLPEVDKIRISEIDLYWQAEGKPTPPKLKSVVLEGDEARRFSQVWRRLNDGPNLGCFSPAYDVAFYSKSTLLFATQICFGCQKLTLPDTDGFCHCPFDAKGPTGQALLRAIQDALGADRYYKSAIG